MKKLFKIILCVLLLLFISCKKEYTIHDNKQTQPENKFAKPWIITSKKYTIQQTCQNKIYLYAHYYYININSEVYYFDETIHKYNIGDTIK